MTKNLIICCAGDDAQIEQWANSSSWDLFIIYYGDNEEVASKYRSMATYFVKQKGYKYELARNILLGDFAHNKERYTQYNYIWFPDADLEISGSDTQRLFDLASQRSAEIFTPSIGNLLFPERFGPGIVWASWSPLYTKPGSKYRRISHPESMMPGFSIWAWEHIFLRSLFLFPQYRVGWGLESVWSALSASYHLNKALPHFVFDDLYVLHLKPVGMGSEALHELGQSELQIYRSAHYPIETVILEEFVQ